MNYHNLFFLIQLGLILIKGGITDQRITRIKRIVHGYKAYPQLIPYQVGLKFLFTGMLRSCDEYSFDINCGGSLILPNYVLTAAHCPRGALLVDVYLGAYDFDMDCSYTAMRSEKIYIHQNYNPETYKNDIALIKLPYSVGLNNKINTISLPDSVSNFVNKFATISGWGRTSDLNPVSPKRLRWAVTKIVDKIECTSYYKDYTIEDAIICTEFENGFGVHCYGDSGGPLVVDGVLVGISSFGLGDKCDTNAPPVYTSVSHYIPWINDIICATRYIV